MDVLIEKLMECKLEVDKLEFDDDVSLDALIDRTKMYIAKLGIRNSGLSSGMFKANLVRDVMWGSNEKDFRVSWEEGKQRFRNIIDNIIDEHNLDKEINNSIFKSDKKKPGAKEHTSDIFIIHGRDNEMKETVSRIIEKLGLEPIILHECEDKGRTIIEKFEYIAKNSGFAVALLSPDDVYLDNGTEKLRARQNVIFELGYFTGILGRERTFVLFKNENNFDMMSDYQGVIYTEFDQSGAWRFKLVKELKAAGYSVSSDSIL